MSPAELEKTTVTIGISSVADKTLRAVGEVLKFEGFLKVYMESKDDDEEEGDLEYQQYLVNQEIVKNKKDVKNL